MFECEGHATQEECEKHDGTCDSHMNASWCDCQRHVCEEYRETASQPMGINGVFRVSVYCDCGKWLRAYQDSII